MSRMTVYVAAAMFCASSAAWAAEPAAASQEQHGQAALVTVSGTQQPKRTVVSLDGTWQIAEGKMEQIPVNFERSVPVPGLVSLAAPAFDAPGPKVANNHAVGQKDPKRDAFWYRRSFALDGPLPAVATLKVAKAMFGTRVFLNGILLGDHLPSFTPGYFDARPALKAGRNEILIRVGADRDAVGPAYPSGFDFEKQRYIPGIFDSVQLILSGTPHFITVQAAPDVAGKTVRVQAVLRNDGGATKAPAQAIVKLVVRQWHSGKVAGQATSKPVRLANGEETTVDVRVLLADCRLWSPEDPFLYTLEADSGTDTFRTRFGMREFKFDPATGRAMLNGRPYFLRGSNFTLYRFFEDGECGKLPWDEKWVRLLHQRVKEMRWNCLRYCIGFPPEAWYDIADEAGMLIDDEFPIWFGGVGWSTWPKELKSHELAVEYGEWMRERWNHPCLAVWDANNETTSDQTGPAIRQVRSLDLSARPWDNSYTAPQEPGDMLESHPYHFNPSFRLRNLATANPQAGDGKHAVVINEYGWHWVNRDGTPTTLTRDIYKNVVGEHATPQQRFHIQATWLAADTEFWRAHRKATAVMHFTTLGYARPDGQTCDHWTQGGVATLQWEPQFYRYVRDAFAPVGLMVDYWNDQPSSGAKARGPVILVNDLYEPWSGPVTLRVKQGDRVLVETKQDARIESLGTANIGFDIVWPEQAGPCVLEAELRGADGAPVRSVRDVEVLNAKVDFRYSPPQWQAAICLPDDPHKSLVDRSGELLYHYNQGGREFGTRIAVAVAGDAAWQKQELLSPRVPIVRTCRTAPGLEIVEEAFAVTGPLRPTLSPFGGLRSDVILVRVTNTGKEPRTLQPQLIVDTKLDMRRGEQPYDQKYVVIDHHEMLSCSLKMTGATAGSHVPLEPLDVPAGKSVEFSVLYSPGGLTGAEPFDVTQAKAARDKAVAYWEHAPLPWGRVQVPDAGIQALVDSSIRNIWQAREIKSGLPAFQVGPTCYRGLWIVDGAFLLEAATILGAGDQARNGVAYELLNQKSDGRIEVMQNYWKENGIVLWTCLRHAQLTQDKAWLESVWPKLQRIAAYIKLLRTKTLENNSPLDDGLQPPGFPDGGIGGVQYEYTNVYWNLLGLRAFVEGARWLGKAGEAAVWQKEYDDFLSAFRKAAARDMKTDARGNRYLPIRMDGQDLPQRGQWGFCHGVYPGQIFAKGDPLVAGNMAMLAATEREGMVYGTGWAADGIWNYFASFYGHAWLWQGNGRKAADVLYAFANHASPMLDWREEQTLKGMPYTKVGDMPHNWASAEFIRLTVHLLALDRGDEMHLLEGMPAKWLGPGMVTRLNGIATPFGPLHLTVQVQKDGKTAMLDVKPLGPNCKAIVVHLPDESTSRLEPRQGGTLTFRCSP